MSNQAESRRRSLYWMVAVLVIVMIFGAFRRYSSDLIRQIPLLDTRMLATGLGCCIFYRVLNSSGWVLVLRVLNQPVPLGRGMRLWLLSESMRWIPGSVWGFCSRVVQATRLGVPPVIASASLPLELLLTIAAWSCVAVAGLVGSSVTVELGSLLAPRSAMFCGAGIAAAVGIVLICLPRMQGRFGAKVQAFLTELRSLRAMKWRLRPLVGALLLYLGLCCLNGIAFSFVARSVYPGNISLSALIGINACGWLMGFLAVGAPGGIGVREAGAALLLGTVMPVPSAIAATVLWRCVMIVDEVCCLGACLAPEAFQSSRKLNRRIACES